MVSLMVYEQYYYMHNRNTKLNKLFINIRNILFDLIPEDDLILEFWQ